MQVDTQEAGPWAGRWSRDVYLDDRGGGRFGRRNTPPARAAPPSSSIKPAPPRPPTGRITVEYDEDAGGGGDDMDGSQLGLRIGAKLRHPQFGVGEVRGWQSAGADLKVTMRFPSAGVKTILARFLTRV
jgi:hypothetical protein